MFKDGIEIENKIIYGDRNESFKLFLVDLMQRCSLDKSIIVSLLENNDIFKMYCNVFTHKSIDPKENYEFFEMIGDVTCNKIIVWYLKDKFPFLCNCDGVKVLARLRINLVSKITFSRWASRLHLDKYISWDTETKLKQETSVLEDVFEAFVGCTEMIIDKYIRGYAGTYCCSNFLKILLDDENIQLSYKKLYDPITRLKETFDYYNSNTQKSSCPYIYGNISFSHEKVDTCLYHVKLLQTSGDKKNVLLQENGKSIIDTKYSLCQKYLNILEEKGFKKQELKYYEDIEKMRIQLEND